MSPTFLRPTNARPVQPPASRLRIGSNRIKAFATTIIFFVFVGLLLPYRILSFDRPESSVSTSSLMMKNDDGLHVVVVLGAPVTSKGTPGPDMKERLDRCLALIGRTNDDREQQHPNEIRNDSGEQNMLIVVTGGTPATYGSSGIKAEALVMADYLVEHGVPRQMILIEPRALHTFHNALYTKQLLAEQGLHDAIGTAKSAKIQRITILTHDWHMRRSLWCFLLVWSDYQGGDSEALSTFFDESQAIPSDQTDHTVQERLAFEQNVLKDGWLESCILREQGNICMPPKEAALTKLKALLSSLG